MTPQLSPQDPAPELQAAFRQHLPRRLRTLLRRARAQCRTGWDCNVAHALHDEIAMLAGACGRCGMLETGERLLALQEALEPAVSVHGIPDQAASAAIDGLLDSLRPHLQQASAPGLPAWLRDAQPVGAKVPFPRCEAPPPGYWLRIGVAAGSDEPAPAPAGGAGAVVVAEPPPPALPPETPRGPRVRIVNDDDPLVNDLLLQLDREGCDVAVVDALDGLIEAMRGVPPDLVVVVADASTPLDPLAAALRDARRDPAQPVRLLVLLRAADVELRLRALRAGADRCVILPASSEDVVAAAHELASVDNETPYRVLIVDDDAPQALFAQAILRRAGMETRVMGESLPVLEELDRFQPDLLLLDLNMPDCDGFELTALIRERDGYLNMPIVFLSGDQDEDRQFAALDAGGDDFLVKPIRPTHLVAAVTNRVRRARTAAARTRRRRRRDSTTGLHERAQLLDALSEHLAAAGGHALHGGLLLAEVCDAAELRERIGLTAFDQLLAQVGEFIVNRARVGTMTARHGAGAFLIFSAVRDEPALEMLAHGFIEAIADLRFGTQALAVRLACGVCGFDATTGEPALALAAVEHALAAASGQPELVAVHSRLAPDPNTLVQRIRGALDTGSFSLAFQPVIPIRGAAGPRYQALLRLHCGEREFAAAELLPAAIRAGLMAEVDAWVVERCIGILGEQRREDNPVCLFASQSLAGWDDAERRAELPARLAAVGASPGELVLEFRCEEIRAGLRGLLDLAPLLRQHGAGLSLAGVDGEAVSAGWLHGLPLDFAKLAPGIAGRELEQVVEAAHANGIRVVAPRVETIEEAERLRDAGVDLMQGNYFQPPAPTLECAPADKED